MKMKRQNAFVFCSAIAALVMTSCAAPQQGAENQETDHTDNKEETASKAEYPQFPFYFVSPESSEDLKNMDFPEALDLREYGLVTPVRLQNPFGTCWGFAAAAAAETSLLGSGIAQADDWDAATLNLSGKHLAYFVISRKSPASKKAITKDMVLNVRSH